LIPAEIIERTDLTTKALTQVVKTAGIVAWRLPSFRRMGWKVACWSEQYHFVETLATGG